MTTRPSHEPIRVGMVGLGWAARSIWLPRLLAHPAFQVVAAVDPDPAARAETESQCGQVRLFSDIDQLTPELVDFAIVAVPNHLHARVACQLLTNRVSVFLEKPVCLNSSEANQLAAAEQAGGAMLLAGSAARYRADVRALHDLVPQLGAIRHIELSWVRGRGGVPHGRGWFTQQQLAGGGALVDLGWHLLDAIGPVLGPTTFDQVVGTVSDDFVNDASQSAAWRRDAGDGHGRGDVEDTARGFLITSEGVSVSFRASWASHEPYDVTRLAVDGSAGSAVLRCTFGFSPNRVDRSSLTLAKDGETVELPVPEEPIGAEYDRQLDMLPAMLTDPASRGRAVNETRRTIDVIERVYASARRSRDYAVLSAGIDR